MAYHPVVTDLLSLYFIMCGRRSCLSLELSWRELKTRWSALCLSGGSTLKITFNTPGWTGTLQDIHTLANKHPLFHYKKFILVNVLPLSHFV
jgi:hypothetical protein